MTHIYATSEGRKPRLRKTHVQRLQELRSREADIFTASLPPVVSSDIWGDTDTEKYARPFDCGYISIDEEGF